MVVLYYFKVNTRLVVKCVRRGVAAVLRIFSRVHVDMWLGLFPATAKSTIPF